MAGSEAELGGDVALLGTLGRVEPFGTGCEVAAGVLRFAVEEEVEDARIDIVVVANVSLRPADRVELADVAERAAQAGHGTGPIGERRPGGITDHQRDEVVKRALLHDEAAVRIGLRAGEIGVERQRALGRAVNDAGPDRRPVAIAKVVPLAAGVDESEVA